MEGVPPFVLWLLISIILILGTLLMVIAIHLKNLRRDLNKFTNSLDKLETRLSDQESRLAEIQNALSNKKEDSVTSMIEAFKKWRTKGLIPALSLLGSQLFRAYLLKKKRKALPSSEDLE